MPNRILLENIFRWFPRSEQEYVVFIFLAPNDQSLYPGLYAGMRNTIMAPERPKSRGDITSTFDESPFNDRIDNDEN